MNHSQHQFLLDSQGKSLFAVISIEEYEAIFGTQQDSTSLENFEELIENTFGNSFAIIRRARTLFELRESGLWRDAGFEFWTHYLEKRLKTIKTSSASELCLVIEHFQSFSDVQLAKIGHQKIAFLIQKFDLQKVTKEKLLEIASSHTLAQLREMYS